MKTPTSIVLTAALVSVGLVGCAHDKEDQTVRTPSQAVATAQNAPESPADDEARVYVDAAILEACGLTLPQAFFSFDSSKLDAEDEQELQSVATCLTNGALADRSVILVGHADPQGSEAYNEQLSEQRAESVMTFFENRGIKSERMEIMPMGEEVASDDADEWPANRRVDVRLVGTADGSPMSSNAAP